MKNLKLLFIVFLFAFAIPVNADLTETQQENIAIFTEKFVETGLNKKDSNGYPLFAYMQGQARIAGYQNKLYHVNKDYQKINTVNASKWTFDCSSFASFIYRHMFDLILTTGTTSSKDSYSGLTILNKNGNPYMVSTFVSDADRGTRFYYVQKNVSISTINYSKMQPGDLIIIKGSHIMVYIGNGKIAHASSSAITSNKELGIEINTLEKKYPTSKFYVIRIKDKVINPTNTGNMTVKWPDDNTISNFSKVETPSVAPSSKIETPSVAPSSKVETPSVAPSLNDIPKITYSVSSKSWVNSLNLIYTINDLDGINAYSIGTSSVPNYTKVSSISNLSKIYKISRNGVYFIYAKDVKANVSNIKIEITNIDNISPEINSISNIDNKIVVNATDKESRLADKAYSFDGSEWASSNSWLATSNKSYTIKVRDAVGNITYSSIVVDTIENKDNNNVNNNTTSNPVNNNSSTSNNKTNENKPSNENANNIVNNNSSNTNNNATNKNDSLNDNASNKVSNSDNLNSDVKKITANNNGNKVTNGKNTVKENSNSTNNSDTTINTMNNDNITINDNLDENHDFIDNNVQENNGSNNQKIIYKYIFIENIMKSIVIMMIIISVIVIIYLLYTIKKLTNLFVSNYKSLY